MMDTVPFASNSLMLGVDERQLALDLQAAAERMWPNMEKHDWAGRTVDQLSPLSFPEFED